jgi:pimeloyl-ACP methyl ester carboxylesterase
MATFVMIHGAWHGGWCFDPLRTLLEVHGHRVVAPDLPGMGGNAEALATVALDDWALFTAGLCREADNPVILCGHSRGGIVVSQTAEVVPDAIAALVYICAMLLPSGLSRVEMKELVAPNPDFEAIILPVPGGTVVDPARAPTIFAQLSPPALANAAAARLVAEPSGPRATPLALTNGRYGSVPRHYIECLHDRTIPIADQRYMQSRQPCVTVTTLEADHSPFLSRPRALADALISIAQGVAR